jgi:hypothetical protein
MRHVLVTAAPLLMLALALAFVETAAAQPPSGQLRASHSGWCLGSGATPAVEPCQTAGSVRLKPVSRRSGAFVIQSVLTNMCLASSRDGRFGWATCAPRSVDQHWAWRGDGTSDRLLRSVDSNRCLYSNADGRFGLYHCTPRFDDQRWRLDADRTGAPAELAGDWQWSDGTLTAMRPNGTFVTPNDDGGTWRARGPRRFTIRWGDGRVDHVALSQDGSALLGPNRRPVARRWSAPPPRPSAPRRALRDCGTGPEDAGCQESRGGLRAMDGESFAGLMQSLRSTRSEVSKRRMIVAASRSQGLTARQLVQMLELFRSEVTQLQVVRAVAPRIIDPQRALGYASRMRSSVSRERMTRLLSAQVQASPSEPQPAPPQPTRRTDRCPRMPACGIACDFGQARDENGCTLCACAPNPFQPR